MKEKTIGIVLTKRTGDTIAGYLAKCSVRVDINRNGTIKAEPVITKLQFHLEIRKTKILRTAPNVCYEDAIKIGKELKKIGFRTIMLIYNGQKEYII